MARRHFEPGEWERPYQYTSYRDNRHRQPRVDLSVPVLRDYCDLLEAGEIWGQIVQGRPYPAQLMRKRIMAMHQTRMGFASLACLSGRHLFIKKAEVEKDARIRREFLELPLAEQKRRLQEPDPGPSELLAHTIDDARVDAETFQQEWDSQKKPRSERTPEAEEWHRRWQEENGGG